MKRNTRTGLLIKEGSKINTFTPEQLAKVRFKNVMRLDVHKVIDLKRFDYSYTMVTL